MPMIKPSSELLMQVYNGNYDNFKRYLHENNVINLDLSSLDLGSDSSRLSNISSSLAGTPLTHVHLKFNKIGDAGAKDFGQFLKGTQVTHVDLSHNQIGDIGAKDFGETLNSTQVTYVELSYNTIGDAGAKDFGLTLKGTQVTHVDLCDNLISSKGAKDFIEGIKGTQVTHVDLSRNLIGARADLATSIPGSNLLELKIHNKSESLSKALYLNRRTLIGSPYCLAELQYHHNVPKVRPSAKLLWPTTELTNEQKHKQDPIGYGIFMKLPYDLAAVVSSYLPLIHAKNGVKISNEEKLKQDQIRYAGGIFINLPYDLAAVVLSFLPLMQAKNGAELSQAKAYLTLAKPYSINKLHTTAKTSGTTN